VSGQLEVHLQQGVAHLVLTRPEAYNSLSKALIEQLISALEQLATAEGVGCVVIRGSGRGFCAGHDLAELQQCSEQQAQQLFEACSQLMLAVEAFPLPVIAQVHGVASAAGCQLLASCDLGYASLDSRFATPGVNIGLFCSTPMVPLTRLIGERHALEMLLTGEPIDAERAEMIGLINRRFSAETLADQVQVIAQALAAKSRSALRIGKRAYQAQRGMDTTRAYQHCSGVMASNLQTEDAAEGIDAFLQKRPARWNN